MTKELTTLAVQRREQLGKGPSRRLRDQKMVPGIFYDAKGDNIPIAVGEMPLYKLWQKAGTSTMFTLRIEGSSGVDERPCLIWKIQHNPVKNRLDHVDMFGVELGKEMKLYVPLEVQGTPKGAEEGGILEIYRDHIEVLCLPRNIPHTIVVDVTDLDINSTVHIEDLTLPEGVAATSEENYALLGVNVPQEQSLEPQTGEEGEEGEEGEAAEGEEEGEEEGE